MDKIFKQLYPGVKEEYLERAFEKLKKNGCPADEDLMVWFGKPRYSKRVNTLHAAFEGG